MITTEQAIRLGRLQERIYRCIEDELRTDGHHKSYEGRLDAILSLPDLFHRGDDPTWTIELHCYVLPFEGRHQSWTARSLDDALAIAEAAIGRVAAHYEQARFDRAMLALDDDPFERDGAKVYGRTRGASK